MKANHNCLLVKQCNYFAVLPITKIQFWKQITTQAAILRRTRRCITNHKDTILKANHNSAGSSKQKPLAVLPITKIQFWKQITTQLARGANYKRCITNHKDTILKANHNCKLLHLLFRKAVLPITKIQFWKQITTQAAILRRTRRCITNHKDTILKANHNSAGSSKQKPLAVLPITKIQFWKQITTQLARGANYKRCITNHKDTILKANHNCKLLHLLFRKAVLPITKIQFWKQITTTARLSTTTTTLYYQSQRYNFESKSQLTVAHYFVEICCITNHKDTILKANHNLAAVLATIMLLYYQSQRYNFESKSQLAKIIETSIERCITNHKDTILKANHNKRSQILRWYMLYYQSQRYNFESKSQHTNGEGNCECAVLPITKIQFWKQITTKRGVVSENQKLYYQSQRYNFESKSQP